MEKKGRHQGLVLEFHERRSKMWSVQHLYSVLPSLPPPPAPSLYSSYLPADRV